MPSKKKRKAAEGEEAKQPDYKDFEAILKLGPRLSAFLRQWLQVSDAEWNFALDKLQQGRAYREWSKSKGRGRGRRYFAAPCDELKLIQRQILNRILATVPVHFARHGNQPGSSILTNARQHVGNQHVFTVDIINAFPTVRRSRIRANLKKPFRFGLKQFAGVTFPEDDERQLLEGLVDLVCLHDRLPQGPPSSPRTLDICCLKMDTVIWQLLNERGTPAQRYKYTAYADDLTISSNEDIPEELRKEILKVVSDHGFVPHTRADKTRYYSPETGSVPVVTGIVICPDGRLTMAPRKVNQMRSRLNYFLKRKDWSDEKIRGEIAGTLGYIRGLYPDKRPSTVRELFDQVTSRLASEKAARPVPKPAPVPAAKRPRKKATPSPKKEGAQKGKAREETLAETVVP